MRGVALLQFGVANYWSIDIGQMKDTELRPLSFDVIEVWVPVSKPTPTPPPPPKIKKKKKKYNGFRLSNNNLKIGLLWKTGWNRIWESKASNYQDISG